MKTMPKQIASTALVGAEYGRWTVTEILAGNDRLCVCKCGTVRVVAAGSLQKGTSKSCVCGRAKRKGDPKKNTPTYRIWLGMKCRCTYLHLPMGRNYAARGVKVCERWKEYDNFLADMGPRPSPKHSIDRFPDQGGNYEPANCRWATALQQANNCRSNRIVTIEGRSLTVSEWSREIGISQVTIHARLRSGWSDDKAVLTPIDETKRNRRAKCA